LGVWRQAEIRLAAATPETAEWQQATNETAKAKTAFYEAVDLVVIEMLAEVQELARAEQVLDPTGTVDLLVMQGGLEDTEEYA
jgi:hypothetical protein